MLSNWTSVKTLPSGDGLTLCHIILTINDPEKEGL